MNKFISRCRRHDDSCWDLISLGSDRLPAHNGGVLVTPELSDRSEVGLLQALAPALPLFLFVTAETCQLLCERCGDSSPGYVDQTRSRKLLYSCTPTFSELRVPSSSVLTIIIATTSSHSWRIPLPPSFLLICEDAAALSLFWRRLWCGSVYWEGLKWKSSIMCWLGRGQRGAGMKELSVWLKSLRS